MWGDPKTLGQVCGAAEPWLGGSRDGALRAEVLRGARMGQSCAPAPLTTRGIAQRIQLGLEEKGREKNLKSLSEIAQLPNSWPAAALSPPVVPAMLGQEEPVSQC